MPSKPRENSSFIVTFSLPSDWHVVLEQFLNLQDRAYPGQRSIHQLARDLLIETLAAHALAQNLDCPQDTTVAQARAPRHGVQQPREKPRKVEPVPVLPPRRPRAPRDPRKPPATPVAHPGVVTLSLPPDLQGLSASELLERAHRAPRSTQEGVQATLDALLGPGAVRAAATPPEVSHEATWATSEAPQEAGVAGGPTSPHLNKSG